MKHKGSCHCGRIAFEADGEITGGLACNCSMCQRKGSLLWFVPPTQFRLLTQASEMGTYTFNQHVIQHHFCPTCGMHPFADGKDRKGNPMVAVNLRCVEDLDLSTIAVQHYDGRAR